MLNQKARWHSSRNVWAVGSTHKTMLVQSTYYAGILQLPTPAKPRRYLFGLSEWAVFLIVLELLRRVYYKGVFNSLNLLDGSWRGSDERVLGAVGNSIEQRRIDYPKRSKHYYTIARLHSEKLLEWTRKNSHSLVARCSNKPASF